MGTQYIINEEYLRSLIIFLLKTFGIKVWDCRPEKCSEPVKINNVPLKSTVGDFIYYWRGIHKVGEVKFFNRFCNRGKIEIRRKLITEKQINILERNTGVAIFVAEPYPEEMKWKRGTQPEDVLKQIREILSKNELQYEVMVLDHENFIGLKHEYLKELPEKFHSELYPTMQKRIVWGRLGEFVPIHKIYLKDFGEIIKKFIK